MRRELFLLISLLMHSASTMLGQNSIAEAERMLQSAQGNYNTWNKKVAELQQKIDYIILYTDGSTTALEAEKKKADQERLHYHNECIRLQEYINNERISEQFKAKAQENKRRQEAERRRIADANNQKKRQERAREAERREMERRRAEERKRREEQERQRQARIAEARARAEAAEAPRRAQNQAYLKYNEGEGYNKMLNYDFDGKANPQFSPELFVSDLGSDERNASPAEGYVSATNKLHRRGGNDDIEEQIEIGESNMEEHFYDDFSGFLRQHIANDNQHPLSMFCDFALNKVCEYYGVDKEKMMMGLCDANITQAVKSAVNEATIATNGMMQDYINDWNQQCKIPTWSEFAEGKSNKQVLSALTIMSTLNDGRLPQPIGSDDQYYYYRLNHAEKIARVTKQGATIDVAPGDGSSIRLSRQHHIESNGQGNPLRDITDAFKVEQIGNIHNDIKPNIRTFTIAEDGSGKQSYIAEGGKRVSSSIQTPEIEYLSSDGSIRVRNNFSQTERTPWTINTVVKPNMKIKFNEFASVDKNGTTLSTGSLIPGATYSANPHEGTVSGKIKVKMPDQTHYSLSYKRHLNGSGDKVTAEAGKGVNVGVVKAEADLYVGTQTSLNAEGKMDRTYFAGFKGSAEAFDHIKVGLKVGVDATPGQTEIMHAHENDTYRSLPSDLQKRLINDIFSDTSTSINYYTNETRVVMDEGGMHTEAQPVTPTEKAKIWEQTISDIDATDIPDVTIAPSQFVLFEDSCIQ